MAQTQMAFDTTRQQFFPFTCRPGITVRAVDSATVYAVTAAIANQVSTSSSDLGLMTDRPVPQGLRNSFQSHTEQFVFYDAEDKPIGWSIGQQKEADTFIMQWTGLVPAYQNQGIYSAFLPRFLDYLRAIGYARVTSNHFVNNRAVLVAKLKAGFIATGMSLDERWGAILWLTHFLDENVEDAFRHAFSLEKYRS